MTEIDCIRTLAQIMGKEDTLVSALLDSKCTSVSYTYLDYKMVLVGLRLTQSLLVGVKCA